MLHVCLVFINTKWFRRKSLSCVSTLLSPHPSADMIKTHHLGLTIVFFFVFQVRSTSSSSPLQPAMAGMLMSKPFPLSHFCLRSAVMLKLSVDAQLLEHEGLGNHFSCFLMWRRGCQSVRWAMCIEVAPCSSPLDAVRLLRRAHEQQTCTVTRLEPLFFSPDRGWIPEKLRFVRFTQAYNSLGKIKARFAEGSSEQKDVLNAALWTVTLCKEAWNCAKCTRPTNITNIMHSHLYLHWHKQSLSDPVKANTANLCGKLLGSCGRLERCGPVRSPRLATPM